LPRASAHLECSYQSPGRESTQANLLASDASNFFTLSAGPPINAGEKKMILKTGGIELYRSGAAQQTEKRLRKSRALRRRHGSAKKIVFCQFPAPVLKACVKFAARELYPNEERETADPMPGLLTPLIKSEFRLESIHYS